MSERKTMTTTVEERAEIGRLITRACEMAVDEEGDPPTSKTELARLLGLYEGAFRCWLLGISKPSYDQLFVLRRAAEGEIINIQSLALDPSRVELDALPTTDYEGMREFVEGALRVTPTLTLVYEGICFRHEHAVATPVTQRSDGRWLYGATAYTSEHAALRARARNIAWATHPSDLHAYLRAIHDAIHARYESDDDPITLETSGEWRVYERQKPIRACGTLLHALYTCATRGALVGWAIDDVVRSRLAIARKI